MYQYTPPYMTEKNREDLITSEPFRLNRQFWLLQLKKINTVHLIKAKQNHDQNITPHIKKALV